MKLVHSCLWLFSSETDLTTGDCPRRAFSTHASHVPQLLGDTPRASTATGEVGLGPSTQIRGAAVAGQNSGVQRLTWAVPSSWGSWRGTCPQPDLRLPPHLLSGPFVSIARICAVAGWSPWCLTPVQFALRINTDLHVQNARHGGASGVTSPLERVH